MRGRRAIAEAAQQRRNSSRQRFSAQQAGAGGGSGGRRQRQARRTSSGANGGTNTAGSDPAKRSDAGALLAQLNQVLQDAGHGAGVDRQHADFCLTSISTLLKPEARELPHPRIVLAYPDLRLEIDGLRIRWER